MGVVYHAWDEELGVAVALKVIRPEVSADPAIAKELEKRFKRELLLARKVSHHNVVRIHDIGEVDAIKYITMTYVDGRDLATILKDAGHLPVPEVLQLIRQLCAGLQEAHSAGVVHRDLKPANIMIAGEHLFIMDFGIARSVVQGTEGGAPLVTQQPLSRSALVTGATLQGAIVGTVAYMSSEQAKGEPADARSDIYAVGMIMRDMLVGMRTTEDPTDALNELMERVQHAPKPVQEIDSTIPDDVDRIVTRCLQPDPAARYQTVPELLADLNGLDAEGHPLPKVRALTKRTVGIAAAAVLALIGGTWWVSKSPREVVQPPPTSVLIANFENRTGDPMFEESLEQTLSTAIEGASFVTVYPRRDAQRLADQIKPGIELDENGARLVSMREGIKVVLAGSVAPRGSGYELQVRAIDPTNGKEMDATSARARDKAGVMKAMQSIASGIRRTLGDRAPESGMLDAGETFTTASLEAARLYSEGQSLQDSYRDAEAIASYKRAIAFDPNFSRAYASWANSASRLGRKEEVEEAWRKALSMIDRMTEREKYRTLGVYYGTVSRNYDKAIENYETLVKLYPADDAGHNNLAVAYFSALNFAKAREEGARALEIYPKVLLYRSNYALYAMYASDFQTAAAQARQAVTQDPEYYPAYLPLAVAALDRGDAAGARDAYSRMAKTGAPGGSVAAIGLADAALYAGRASESVPLLQAGITEDEKSSNIAGIASKYVALAEAYADQGRSRAATEALQRAMKSGRPESVLVPAARLLRRVGVKEKAATLARELDARLQPQSRAYARIIQGEIAREDRRLAAAVDELRAAQKLADFWLGRFELGVTYIEAGYFAEALSELETCQKRRGEATAIFLDDVPSFRYLAPLSYWLARAQEGLGQSASAAANYNKYIALRSAARRDPLLADARKRLVSLQE